MSGQDHNMAQVTGESPAKAMDPPSGQGVEPSPPQRPPLVRKRQKTGLRWRLGFLAVVLGLVIGAAAVIGRALPLPVWVVAEVETRLNQSLAESLPDLSLSLGEVDLTLDEGFVPRLMLQDMRLLKPDGTAVLAFPEVRLSLQGRALLSGEARLSSLRITGARLSVTRDAEGRFDFAFGQAEPDPGAPSAVASQPGLSADVSRFGDLFDQLDQVLASPGFMHLTRIEAEGLSVSLNDQRIGHVYQLGDGRLTLDNRPDSVAAELSVSLQGAAALPGRAVVQVVTEKAQSRARVSAEFSDISAADLAAQAPLLAPLGVVQAAISGRMAAELDERGITEVDGALQIGKGVLRPTPASVPVPFDRASFAIAYDAPSGEVRLSRMEVQSPTLRAAASGQSFLIDATGARMTGPLGAELPSAFVSQFRFDDVRIDPEGVFVEPVQFSTGALDFRLRLEPFSVEIGQLSLAEDNRRLGLTGQIGADAAGWTAALDLTLNQISKDRLVALWPTSLLARTRDWVGRNLLEGNLHDIHAAFRLAPGAEPRLHLAYGFEGAEVKFLRSLPPIEEGKGYSTIEGLTYTMVLTQGHVTPPQGGQIDMAGSVFAVPDVSAKPAIADIRLSTRSSLTAALSLLNEPPFGFLTKANQPVDLGTGRAEIQTRLRLPLIDKIGLADISYDVRGRVFDFSSDRLVPNRRIKADQLAVQASPKGLEISGQGQLGDVAFDATYAMGFAPEEKGRSSISGNVMLSQKATEEFGLGLPQGMVSGQGQAAIEIDLQRGAPGQLRLRSDLRGIGLTLPEIGWTKGAASTGRLAVEMTLGSLPKVNRLELEAGGLSAKGAVTMREGGGLELARFDRVTLGDWLDASVDLVGRGTGAPVAIALTGGSVDIRYAPGAPNRAAQGAASARASGPLRLDLDRLIVSRDIALTGFRGSFNLNAGFNGEFDARVNDGPEVKGTVVPSRHGTAVRLRSATAGEVFAAAGIFSSGRGGALDMTLTPRETKGHYDGRLTIRDVRVRNASVLAELLNAISVVGLLEQLYGQGLVFNIVEGEFLLTPQLVDLRRGSATGASLGVSMAGVYQSGSGQLTMEGVISPVYMLNGIGAVLTRRGEGVFGFNYGLTGTAEALNVSVNPLSILTPGGFRNMFRGGQGGILPRPDPRPKQNQMPRAGSDQ